MSWLDTGAIEKILRYMDVAAMREKLAVGNIANIDTPGYKTQDINFHQALERADQNLDAPPLPPQIEEPQGLIERPDGNNVSLDRETIVLAGVQLEYRTAIALLRQEFQRIQMAINANNGA
ncbi:MAG: flagellar biosynthesis protein FlgB [Acidobacteriota bacterium]|nr:flagellar biosynthesis protein FlgB [Acidobacteriota bacterium]